MIRFLPIILLALVSCAGNDLPKDILPQEKMQLLVWDMLRADELVNHHAGMDSTFDRFVNSTVVYNSVFRMHGTTQTQFRNSFRYYQSNPRLMRPLLDSLEARSARSMRVAEPGIK